MRPDTRVGTCPDQGVGTWPIPRLVPSLVPLKAGPLAGLVRQWDNGGSIVGCTRCFPVPGDIEVQQPPDHGLIVGLVLPGLLLEKINTRPAQADGDLDAFIFKD